MHDLCEQPALSVFHDLFGAFYPGVSGPVSDDKLKVISLNVGAYYVRSLFQAWFQHAFIICFVEDAGN